MPSSSLPFQPLSLRARAVRPLLVKAWEPERIRAERDRARRNLGLARIGVVVASAAAVALGFVAVRQPVAEAAIPVPAVEPGLISWVDGGVPVVVEAAKTDGPKPVKGQKVAPCDTYVELEVSGVCWILTPRAPPCLPAKAVEWEGKCIAPVSAPAKVPTSLEP